jgi:hypothetical protein
MPHELEWTTGTDGDVRTAPVETLDDLRQLLDEREREALANPPFMVDLRAEDGSRVGIGLGRGVSVAHYVSANGDPPYFLSKGQIADLPDVIVFYAGGQWSEFPGSGAIANADARSAVEEFFTAGGLPSSLDWEET